MPVISKIKIYSYEKAKLWCIENRVDSQEKFRALGSKIPDFIPSNPERTFKEQGTWPKKNGWGDFLGTGRIANQDREFVSYDQASKFYIENGVKTSKGLRTFTKNNVIPDNIPRDPAGVYEKQGTWKGWGDFFGTGRIANQDREFVSYDLASKFYIENGIKTSKGFRTFIKDNVIPDNIPLNPPVVYEGTWKSWGDFLGTGRIANQDREFVSYGQASKFYIENGVKTQSGFRTFIKDNVIPDNIPLNPPVVYEGTWKGWGDFLGTGRIANQYVDKFRKVEWLEWLNSMKDQLINLDRIILLDILEQAKISKFLKEIGQFDNLVKSQVGSKEAKDTVKNIKEGLEVATDKQIENSQIPDTDTEADNKSLDILDNSQSTESHNDETITLPTINSVDELDYYDDAKFSETFSSDETIDFYKKYHENKVWNDVINNRLSLDMLSLSDDSNSFKKKVLENVLEDYHEITTMKLLDDFVKDNGDGTLRDLTIMQKLIAIRFRKTDKIGNWSDTGTGKTLAALYATREHGKNTVIVCLNANIDTWKDEITKYFKDNNISCKIDYKNRNNIVFTNSDKSHNYLILNVETFQQPNIDIFIYNLTKKNNIDCIIVDEVQSIKTRDDDNVSLRTESVSKLVQTCREINSDFKLMLMSATPIINNFNEPKNLIELMTGEEHADIDTTLNVQNGLKLFKLLTRYGIRFRQDKKTKVNEIILDIDGSDIDLKKNKIGQGNYLQMENLLLDHKLNAILPYIVKKETLIYIEYVDGITSRIKKFLNKHGISVEFYTGAQKDSRLEILKRFKEGKIDVLVGSKPITTGINGLQHCVSVMINLIMMWTKADEEQFRGRVINRKGIPPDKEIAYVVPIVHLKDGDTHIEYDSKRLQRIKQKGVLTDMVLDGTIPEGKLPPKEKLLESVLLAIDSLKEAEVGLIRRRRLKFPLDLIEVEFFRRKYGEFSEMNQKWSVCNSYTLSKRLKEDPNEWAIYHELYREARSKWDEIPVDIIAEKIKKRPDWIVGDFGCGENILTKTISNKIFAMDHVAIDDSVITCDISKTPLADNQLDCVVFSLSLMGSNYKEYLQEAYRTLRNFGYIFICEPRQKWENKEESTNVLLNTLHDVGFSCNTQKKTEKFIYIEGTKNA
jgi:superfamily II DNA or RNA helicase